MALVIRLDDRGVHGARLAARIQEKSAFRRARAFARPQHDPPVVGRVFLEQQDFKLSAGLGIGATQAGGDHPRVVQHQHVAGRRYSSRSRNWRCSI